MQRGGALLLLILATACQRDTVPEQQARGVAAYAAYCQACHEQEDGIGPRLTPAVLATRMTAERLFAYNRDKMPYNAGKLLTDEQYWDITAYLLARSGMAGRDEPLWEGNADFPLSLPTQ